MRCGRRLDRFVVTEPRATLPTWQGYGIYPRLLQSILAWQVPPVELVWILYAPENTHQA